jgi:hypothetical protein
MNTGISARSGILSGTSGRTGRKRIAPARRLGCNKSILAAMFAP